ncbi:MAG: F0F1 ATP synthase subunit A [Bacteroidetes bacterium]|nr:F0F1 ATP synthase subunit A [Bacteroidota bacterium]
MNKHTNRFGIYAHILVALFFVAVISANAVGQDHAAPAETMQQLDNGTTKADAEAHAVSNDTHAEAPHEEAKFDAGKMIVEHISDAHDWHIAGHFSIPLPVLIYSPTKGFHSFLSSKFNHGHDAYNGFRLEHNEIVAEDGSKLYDLSITKNVFAMLISVVLLILIFTSVAKAYSKRTGMAPKGLQSLIEPLIVFVRDDIAKASIGPHYQKYMPYLLTAFFFIWINNLLGLIPIFPFGANVTGSIAVAMVLAVITLVIVTVKAKPGYWMHIVAMPGVPKWVLFLLTPIEILGFFLRPFVLMIRLFANITAGHIIALAFFSLIFIFGEMNTGAGIGAAIFSTAFVVFMTVLELLVAFLQAFVFTLLSAIYIGAAIEDHHHDSHAHETKAEMAH